MVTGWSVPLDAAPNSDHLFAFVKEFEGTLFQISWFKPWL
jgi:hypothetical protein